MTFIGPINSNMISDAVADQDTVVVWVRTNSIGKRAGCISSKERACVRDGNKVERQVRRDAHYQSTDPNVRQHCHKCQEGVVPS
jgi:hypothetical protein